jgi:hypothetical protein
MNVKANVSDLTIYFSVVNIPVLGYLFTETWKPSGTVNTKQE